jgi:hypothetical protein
MKRIGGLFTKVLTMLALATLLMLPAVSVNAQYGQNGRWGRRDRWDRRGDYYGSSFQLRQTALNAGYNEGIKEGRTDRRRGERFEYRDERDFRRADIDYSSRLGNRGLYMQYFRQGFANGYRDGWNGY